MKLTVKQLKGLIRESVKQVLNESQKDLDSNLSEWQYAYNTAEKYKEELMDCQSIIHLLK